MNFVKNYLKLGYTPKKAKKVQKSKTSLNLDIPYCSKAFLPFTGTKQIPVNARFLDKKMTLNWFLARNLANIRPLL